MRGIDNLMNIYLEICDAVMIVDHTNTDLEVIAEATKGTSLNVLNAEKWNKLKSF